MQMEKIHLGGSLYKTVLVVLEGYIRAEQQPTTVLPTTRGAASEETCSRRWLLVVLNGIDRTAHHHETAKTKTRRRLQLCQSAICVFYVSWGKGIL